MSFRHRNALYLRVSLHRVLPLYLYLDDKHIKWMSDSILQEVLADLKPFILKKLRDEEPYKSISSGPNAKKFGIVDVHRAENYQVAYFLQRNESHHLLIKTRTFSAKPVQPQQKSIDGDDQQIESPKAHPVPAKKRPTTKTKKRKRAQSDDIQEDEESDNMEDEEDQDNQTSLPLRRSARKGTRAIYAEMSDEGDDDPGTSMGNRALDDRTDENQATSNNKNDSENDSVQVIRVKAEPEDPDINLLLAGTAPMPEDEADHEVEMSDDSTRPGAMGPPSTLPKHRLRNFPEEEEEKPKPVMGLRYQGYTVPDICLAIIVEPRHPDDRGHSRASSREPSVTVRGTDGNLSRYLGAGPIGRLSITPAPEARKQTPLPLFREFTPLPGESDDFREKTPAPSGSSAPVMFGRAHSPIPAFNNDLDSAFEGEYPAELELDGEVEELLHFSQAMNPNRVGGIGGEESDEDDARVLLADADEGR